MTSDVGVTYRFADPNPSTAILRLFLPVGVAITVVVLLVLTLVGLLPILGLVVGAMIMVIGSVSAYSVVQMSFGGDSGVVLSPDHLIMRTRARVTRYAWNDVSSVALGSTAELSSFDAFAYRTFLARFVPSHVRISLRRSIWIRGRTPVRVRTLDLYLEEPEAFVEEAQRHFSTGRASIASP
jgi:hypothetical protein